ncbi:hypothetical protein QFZ56_001023 [Streptomyces achromogenes]|uniref:Transposase IS701-like DDE domain-containing protein n=1 Tax=Streptomyces achromogenes TaxID=67255 RepID=A0ABU0PUJ3_STRAH|nr:hypothetical protein [Streptomyces achromogenes]
MDAHEVNRARAKSALFVADVFGSVPRKDQRAKGDCHLRGLAGRAAQIQPMAELLEDGNEQNLQQFVNRSTWDPLPIRRRIAERMLRMDGADAARRRPTITDVARQSVRQVTRLRSRRPPAAQCLGRSINR